MYILRRHWQRRVGRQVFIRFWEPLTRALTSHQSIIIRTSFETYSRSTLVSRKWSQNIRALWWPENPPHRPVSRSHLHVLRRAKTLESRRNLKVLLVDHLPKVTQSMKMSFLVSHVCMAFIYYIHVCHMNGTGDKAARSTSPKQEFC